MRLILTGPSQSRDRRPVGSETIAPLWQEPVPTADTRAASSEKPESPAAPSRAEKENAGFTHRPKDRNEG